MNDKNPPRVFGIILAVLGAALAIGGVNLLGMGGGYYFLAVGIGVALSGVLMASGRLLGAYAYGATLLMLVVWSLVEAGSDLQQLLPRIALPVLIGLYVFSSRVRSRLA